MLVSQYLPEFSSICNTRRYWSLPKYEYCRYWKILGNTGNTSIADTGRFWKILVIPVLQILVIPVLQILEDSGNTSIADTGRFWKILVIPVLQILED
jgi:nitric oxide reductase large subunit